MTIQLHHFLCLSGALFALGLFGVFWNRRTVIHVLMSIELMLNSVNINLVAFSRYSATDAAAGQVFSLFIIAVAAAEVAVGLALAYAIYRGRDTVSVDEMDWLKW